MRAYEILNELQLPKNKWELITSNKDKNEAGDELVGLVQTAYSNTPKGSLVNALKDVIPSHWDVMDWDQDPDIDSTVFYRTQRPNETWVGYKIQGIGHDGTRTSKDKAIDRTKQLLTRKGWWIESSDAMRYVLKKHSIPAVTDENFLQMLFNDTNLRIVTHDTYERKLSDGTSVIETVFGNPVLRGNK